MPPAHPTYLVGVLTVAMPPPANQNTVPTTATTPIVPPPVVPPPAPEVLPPATIQLLDNVLQRYLDTTVPYITYPYWIVSREIDPDIIRSRVVVDRVAGRYQWRVMSAVPAGGTYPVGYQEVETVLVHATISGLMMAILGSFSPNRGQTIRQVSGQTGDFLDWAVEECPNIEITDQLTLMN